MMIELAMMSLMATAAPENARAELTGWLRIDGRAAVAQPGACKNASDVLASVVFVDQEDGTAVERVDITCASRALKFDTRLAPGRYRAVAWPGVDATNLVARPYTFEQVIDVGPGHNDVTLEEITVPVHAAVQADCSLQGEVVLVDTNEPFSQTVPAQCSGNTIRFSARVPAGVYEVHLEKGESSRTLASQLEVKRQMPPVVLSRR